MAKSSEKTAGYLSRGFTIIELMIVISIIAVLATLVSSAAISSIREAREKDGRIMAQAVKMGIANYHAQFGEWPGAIENYAESGRSPSGNPGHPGALSTTDADKVVQIVVEESGKGNSLIDASGLFVASKAAADSRHGHGLKFGEARRQNVALANMAFGYQRKKDGEFRRFLIRYDPTNDTVSVERPEE